MRANEFGDPGGGRAHRLLKVGGLAGTGKTTLLSKFAAETNVLLVAYCAYTGRAASLLARKFKAFGVRSTSKTLLPEGMKPTERALESCYEEDSPEMDMPFVGTIHRLLYRPVIDPVTEELKGWVKRRDSDRAYDSHRHRRSIAWWETTSSKTSRRTAFRSWRLATTGSSRR